MVFVGVKQVVNKCFNRITINMCLLMCARLYVNNSQHTILGSVIRSKRGGTSTATKNKRKTRDEKVLHYNTLFK